MTNQRAGFRHQFESVYKPGARADFVESESSNPKFNLYDVIQDGPNLKLAKTDDPSTENDENSEFEIDQNFSSNFQAYEEEIHDKFETETASDTQSDLELMNELKKKVFDYTGNFQNFETGNFYFMGKSETN